MIFCPEWSSECHWQNSAPNGAHEDEDDDLGGEDDEGDSSESIADVIVSMIFFIFFFLSFFDFPLTSRSMMPSPSEASY